MRTPLRLTAYTLGLVGVFGSAVGVGSLVGPTEAAPPPAHGDMHTSGTGDDHDVPGGLQVAQDGYLQPYLGAYGHLVALRDGDLAYLHVHPDGAPGDGRTAAGPDVVFHAEVP